MRRKDVVLMATVTSFEGLQHPSRSELRQFAELFAPLFAASTEEARRQAVAALSQAPNVPAPVAFFIASQPIAIAAPFLIASNSLDDETLITIARTQGAAHAKAIARREALSPTVIDALVGLRHQPEESRVQPQTASPSTASPATSAPLPERETERLQREEQLRSRIKALANHIGRSADDRLGLRSITTVQEALLVRFARNRETGFFASVLADTLSASRWLSERIMLDISGQQLAATLKGLAMEPPDAIFILERLYDHLSDRDGHQSRAERMWQSLDADECGRRVEAWRRADSYTYAPVEQDSGLSETRRDESAAANREDSAQWPALRSVAGGGRTVHARRGR